MPEELLCPVDGLCAWLPAAVFADGALVIAESSLWDGLAGMMTSLFSSTLMVCSRFAIAVWASRFL